MRNYLSMFSFRSYQHFKICILYFRAFPVRIPKCIYSMKCNHALFSLQIKFIVSISTITFILSCLVIKGCNKVAFDSPFHIYIDVSYERPEKLSPYIDICRIQRERWSNVKKLLRQIFCIPKNYVKRNFQELKFL